MDTHSPAAPRTAANERPTVRREGRTRLNRSRIVSALTGFGVAIAIAACSPGASTVPLPSVVVPSIDASAVASAGTQAALAALDQVDAAITANQTSGALTADDATSLKQLSSGIRTALQSGDMTAAKTAVDNLATKVDALASKLSGDAGTQLKAAITALKAAVASS